MDVRIKPLPPLAGFGSVGVDADEAPRCSFCPAVYRVPFAPLADEVQVLLTVAKAMFDRRP